MTYEVRGSNPLLIKGSDASGECWYRRTAAGNWSHCADHKGPWLSMPFERVPADVFALALTVSRESAAMVAAYPPDWPTCPGCGAPALDGHITCGNVTCDEGGRRS